MTLLVTSVYVVDEATLRQRCAAAFSAGADAVELRIDSWTGDVGAIASFLRENADRTWIVTCRSRAEGGESAETAEQRAALIATATRDTNAYVDFEFADWRRSGEVRRVLGETAAIEDSPTGGSTRQSGGSTRRRLILSSHRFDAPPDEVAAVFAEMASTGEAAVFKTAFIARDICDAVSALDLLRQQTKPAIAICMGDEGLMSRVLSKKFGAFATYAGLSEAGSTAPGQLTTNAMKNLYRWDAIDGATRVFGVIGDPVAHSLGPRLFNRWFADAEMNAVYLPMRVTTSRDCLARFLTVCAQQAWLDVAGLSVTIPHKTGVLRWLGDRVDRTAQGVGAVNTVVFAKDGPTGFNTDCHAAAASIGAALGCRPDELADVSIDLLGTGGAARAILSGLCGLGCPVTLYGRSAERTKSLAEEFGCRAAAWDDRGNRSGDVLVNCTSVGMWPHVDASPMPSGSLDGLRLVFDTVYNPLETKLLVDAKAAGAATQSGLDMFIRQAAAQFELWTGQAPDVDAGRRWLMSSSGC
ncbi:MAG: type I 3-dehydroquinate dehydratase [Planctomycetes bacterium]|nr:type I 3-dehydroquinate dehydratase [Planctomycetota bacterium]